MTTELKYAALDRAAGGDWQTVYTCPVGKSAIIKAVIGASDGSSSASGSAYLAVNRAGLITPLAVLVSTPDGSSVNLLAGTLALEANDILVTKSNVGSRFKKDVAIPGGNLSRFEANGSTVIAVTSTGIYRTTDFLTWTQVYVGVAGSLIARIGSAWFCYSSATASLRSTDDGLTWASQAVTNAPTIAANKAGGGILKNGSTFAGLTATGAAMTTTTDGITWTVQTAFPFAAPSLVWTGTNYVATRGATDNSVYYSTNGTAWTTVAATGITTHGTGSIATNGAGVIIAFGSATGQASRSTDHGATWSTLVTGGPAHIASPLTCWTGSVFAVQTTSNYSQISSTGAQYTWGTASIEQNFTPIVGLIYGGNVYYAMASGIRVSDGLTLPATAGLAVTASIMEVF